MQKILLAIFCIFLIAQVAYCDSQSTTIETDSSKSAALFVKIEAVPQITKVKKSESIEVSIRISNASNTSQTIGTEICGAHQLVNWITDDQSVSVEGASCRINIVPPREVILKPGEIYEQTCIVFFKWKTKLGPLTFRLGLQPVGHMATWSNPITVEILSKH